MKHFIDKESFNSIHVILIKDSDLGMKGANEHTRIPIEKRKMRNRMIIQYIIIILLYLYFGIVVE